MLDHAVRSLRVQDVATGAKFTLLWKGNEEILPGL